MRSTTNGGRSRRRTALVVAAALTIAGCSATRHRVPTDPDAAHFGTPAEAVAALIDAARRDDTAALVGVLGPDAEDVIASGDPVADRNARARFAELYDEAHAVDQIDDTTAEVEVGPDAWPFPIPLVKDDLGWRFDLAGGEEELLARRVGRNELSTIQFCRAYVDAQREYYLRNPENAELFHFASRVLSTEGRRDGLYWPTDDDEPLSPLGPLAAEATAEGYAGKLRGGNPYHGYFARILTAQGEHAPGGAYDYVVRGKMIGGFAMVAFPADYDVSGVMTFLVSHDGTVYERDLGPDTEKIARAMTTFDPGPGWAPVEDDDTPS